MFFTADTHFGHTNIIKYCNRPFSSIEEMDEILIENWNKIVTKKDIIYHLGDVAFRNAEQYVKKLNGQIHLITGNHDRKRLDRYRSISQIKVIRSVNPKIVMCHHALRSWPFSHNGAWHLYGHSHGRLPENESLSFDIGVDCWEYKPVSYEMVREKMELKKRILEELNGN